MKRDNSIGPLINSAGQTKRKTLRAVFVLGAILAGLELSTQYFAIATGAGTVIAPWKIIEWSFNPAYSGLPAYKKAVSLGVFVTSVLMLAILFRIIVKSNSSKYSEFLHGSARWANKNDIEAAGLFGNEGVYVGAWKNKKGKVHYLRHNGLEHILCYAPTRSGKGVGLVVPSLLSWKHSAVILDLKGELWEMTAGWRKEYADNKVLRFEPASPFSSVGFNPLQEIRMGTEYEVSDVQNLATLLVDPDGRGLESHWQKTAQSLLVGVILHLLYKSKADGLTATLSTLDSMLSNPSQPIHELWEEMTKFSHLETGAHPVVAAVGRDMLDRAEEEAGSVLSSTKSYLALYRDPIVAKNTSKSEFRIHDLMNNESAISLYIITQPNDKVRLRPLIRILVNMILRLLTDKLKFENGKPIASYKHRLLMMLDEFPSLGKLEIMQESLAFIAGYGIKCYIIVQDISQLHSHYGRDESITSNCHIQNAFPPNRLETAEHLSKLTGQTTIVKKQITTSGRRISAILHQVSSSYNEVQRPLLTADECMRLPAPVKNLDGLIEKPGDMIISCAGYPAIYGMQPLYFIDPVFQKRSEIPPPAKTDKIIEPVVKKVEL